MVDWYPGTMGFSYKEWSGAFYPAGLASRHFLAYYSQRFDAVEVDSTFYGPPRVSQVERWTAVTPAYFKFCLKTPRAITHDRRLVDAIDPMLDFLEVAQRLGHKLGAILLQFPPDFTHKQADVLARFLPQLPPACHYAVEFRHRSWDNEQTAALLQQHQIAWASTDYIYLPHKVYRTTDFLYVRFIGPHGQFDTKDRELVDKTADLQQWHQKISPHLPHVKAVYSFFNNDYAGYSPATCNRFKTVVGLPTKDIRVLQQGRLF